MGFFRRKAEGYRAAVRVERYRAAAVQLRNDDPETYAQMLAQADGSDAEGAARRDPDAYVALLLAAMDDLAAEGSPLYDSPFSDVKRSADDVLVKEVAQPYHDLAEVLDRASYAQIYEGCLNAFREVNGAEPGPLFRDNPSWVVGGVLQESLEAQGYTLDDVSRVVADARASGQAVPFDLGETAEEGHDFDWADIDHDALWHEIGEFWRGAMEEANGPKYFPRRVIRRDVALRVVKAAADSRPDLDAELAGGWESVGLTEESFFDEDPGADERLAAFLQAYDLGRIVDVYVNSLSAEDTDES